MWEDNDGDLHTEMTNSTQFITISPIQTNGGEIMKIERVESPRDAIEPIEERVDPITMNDVEGGEGEGERLAQREIDQ